METTLRFIAAVLVIQTCTSAAIGQERAATSAPQFWAYRPLVVPEIPRPDATAASVVDRFVLARLEQQGLSMAPEADAHALVRRLYFDVLGLPPSPFEARRWTAALTSETGGIDRRQLQQLVDRLLASPAFGQRWGRHWLDWSGYVDVYGKDNDYSIIKPLKDKWRYRDYVVDSLNSDKPIDQFVTEQLAGDELVDWRQAEHFDRRTRDRLTATGFLLCSDDDTDQKELNTPDIRHHVLQQTGEIVANNLFGMTMQCAKCHDHKYEAITQRDYYRWLAIFSPVFNPARWVTAVQHDIADISPAEKSRIDHQNADVDSQIKAGKAVQAQLLQKYRALLFDRKLQALPASLRDDLRKALATPAGKRSVIQKYLAAKLETQVRVDTAAAIAAMDATDKRSFAAASRKIAMLPAKKRTYGSLQVAIEKNPPSPTHVLIRGEFDRPGKEVDPGIPAVLAQRGSPRHLQPQGATSGRRLRLAAAVTDEESTAGGLVARVFVNRVWQEMLGRGIVATSDNVGVSGSTPTHPELLNYLAFHFARDGWQLKPLIRRLAMSRVYRQSSVNTSSICREKDPDNNLLWRARLRRLPAEVMRDSILAVSGRLNRRLGGPPVPLKVNPDGSIVIDDAKLAGNQRYRRSLYVLARRNYHLSFLSTFDQPLLTSNCTVRRPAAVVNQSLTMLNDAFVLRQASFFADRVLRESTTATPQQFVQTAFLLAFSRPPRADETTSCVAFLRDQTMRLAISSTQRKTPASTQSTQRQALVQLCHMLMNTNEFLYIP